MFEPMLEFGDRTVLTWTNTGNTAGNFDLREAQKFLCSVSEENASVFQLQRLCFPEELWILPGDTDAASKKKRKEQLRRLHAGADAKDIRLSGRMLSHWFKFTQAGPEEGVKVDTDLQSGQTASIASANGLQTRRNLYKLCAVLGYDAEQTETFIAKTTFLSAFNVKIWQELCFWFFVSRREQDWYARGQRLIDAIEQQTRQEPPDANRPAILQTQRVESDVSQLTSPEELRDYILENWATFQPENLYHTAHQELRRLYDACLPYAAGEWHDLDVPYKSEESDNSNELSAEVFYRTLLERQTIVNEGVEYPSWTRFLNRTQKQAEEQAKNSSLLAGIRMNREKEIESLKHLLREDAVLDQQTLRHLMLLLGFYLFYAQCRHTRLYGSDRRDPAKGFQSEWGREAELDYSGYFDEFCGYLDQLLFRAGLVPLYPNSAYDCLILLAAQTPRPLDTLRELVSQPPEPPAGNGGF